MLLVATDPAFEQHDTGPGHPERARRLEAALRGPEAAGLADAIRLLEPREATAAELSRVHPLEYLEALERFCAAGGGDIDGDTRASAGSWRAGKLAAGAGLAAVEALQRGEGDAAFLAVRPPGHHALATRPMGFCLINNIAVVAAHLAERGERVLVLDWDAHHGNGTEAIFWDDPRSSTSRPTSTGSSIRGRAPSKMSAGPEPGGRRSTCRSRPAPPATSTSRPSTRSSPRLWRSSTPPGCWSRPGTTPTGPIP